ncbi:hypothetical protein K501DRAFT_296638 [Backusella circina FSU 941]|nr:hypothetical protein K501DRAFT_296638 [Backusella circina FSU 941]
MLDGHDTVSKSELCGVSSDGDKRVVIAVDGGYTLFIKQFEDLCIKKNIELNDNNLFYPIRKEPYQDLNIQEKHFNDVFGSFRSAIENQFYLVIVILR